MRKSARLFLFTFVVAAFGLLGGVFAPKAGAVGAEIYRTDRSGNKTGTVTRVGNTGPACCCFWYGSGTLGVGVRVCYLPIP
jgi:hypothetical protein